MHATSKSHSCFLCQARGSRRSASVHGNSSKDPYNVQHVWSSRGSRSESCRFCLLLQDDALKWPLEAAKLSVPTMPPAWTQSALLPALASGGQPTNIGRLLDQRLSCSCQQQIRVRCGLMRVRSRQTVWLDRNFGYRISNPTME